MQRLGSMLNKNMPEMPEVETVRRIIEPLIINKAIDHGYKGLVEGEIEKVDRDFAKYSASLGGTVIKTARLPEFKQPEVQKIAINNLKKLGIDALIVIGGDGSYMGAKKLSEQGINCIGLPGTIDNDISSTDYAIGFDTALNNVIHAP